MRNDPEREVREAVAERKRTALERAERVLVHLRSFGVKASLFGSVTTDRFGLNSDVDFLVHECPEERRYRIESGVERIMQDIPFDVVYYDEVSDEFRRLLTPARHAGAKGP